MPFVDSIITSPPYEGSYLSGGDSEARKKRLIEAGHDPKDFLGGKARNAVLKHYDEVDAIITSPPYSTAQKGGGISVKGHFNDPKLADRSYQPKTHGENSENIGNLPHGEIDAVITSPPYEGSLEGTTRHTRGGIASRDPALAQTGTYSTVLSFGVPVGYSPNKDNIGNLKSSDEEYEKLEKGIDAVITSPPYGHEATPSKRTRLEEKGEFKMGHSKEVPYTDEDYRSWDRHEGGNIAKRKLFIRVPCSPEEAQFHDTRPGRKGTVWEYTKEVEATPELIEKIQNLKSKEKGRSETYLEAMLRVYAECYKTLKPGGLIIVIVKPFIRNKRVVDLPWHTWLLLRRCGFRLVEVLKFRLPSISFWRILYRKKHSEVERINHEYVIVACK